LSIIGIYYRNFRCHYIIGPVTERINGANPITIHPDKPTDYTAKVSEMQTLEPNQNKVAAGFSVQSGPSGRKLI
jgi:hypothetical protein